MPHEFAFDLRLARRKAGYTQRDVAHLMGVQQSLVSDLEQGRRLPDLTEIITLSLIYGRTFEAFFASLVAGAKQRLRERVVTLPDNARVFVGTRNRAASLRRLVERIEADDDHAGA